MQTSTVATNSISMGGGASLRGSAKSAIIELNQPKKRAHGERETKGLGDDHPLSLQSFVLFSIPAITFGLGIWQIKRLKWKKEVLAELERTGNPNGIQLRNDHMSYILTWFTLSAITTLMWAQKFIRKVR